MKSRISFFNGTVLKKDITRFAPVWGLYVVCLLYNIYTCISFSSYSYNSTRYELSHLGSGFIWPYAFLCATLLFGDLFKSRMCNALHAMPLRRDHWFFSHVMAGILFAIVPNTLVALIMIPLLKHYASIALLWWLTTNGTFLFCFALSVFCVMCVGNRLGHIVVFGILGFFPILVYVIYSEVYKSLLYGITSDGLLDAVDSPTMLLNGDYFEWDTSTTVYYYKGVSAAGWIQFACCIVLGVLLLLAALRLYRRRKLEWAGEFIHYAPLQWLLLILGSCYAAIIIPIAGFPIGFFLICMLQERTIKVFHKKNWIRFCAAVAVLLVTLGLTALDPLGIVTRIPDADDVESVEIGSAYSLGHEVLTDPQGIQAAIQLHEYALDNRDYSEENWYSLRLTYHLKNGTTLTRSYTIDLDAVSLKQLTVCLSSFEVLFGTPDVDGFMDSVYCIEENTMIEQVAPDGTLKVTNQWQTIPSEEHYALFENILLDCEGGLLAQDPSLHNYGEYKSLRIWYYGDTGLTSMDIRIYAGSLTYACLS